MLSYCKNYQSFLLFLFFNINLIKNVINKNRKTIVFVDDYITWLIDDSTEFNIIKLQNQVINLPEKLASRLSTIFHLDKSYLTHFT